MNGLLVFLFCYSLVTLMFPFSATGSLLVFNTSLTITEYPSYMFSQQYTHFPEWPFEGRLLALTFTPRCVLSDLPKNLGETKLVGVIKMHDANAAKCERVYNIIKAMQEKDSRFVGLLVNIGIGLEMNNWFIARRPFQDVADLKFPAAEINQSTWDVIKEFVGENGEGDIWVHVNDDAHEMVSHFEESGFQADRYCIIALWVIAGLLLITQIVIQNRRRWKLNTSTKVLFLCLYSCVANIIHMAIDPWELDVNESLFGLTLFVSAVGALYLAYVVTVFKWVKLFNVLGHKSWVFKARKPVIGMVIGVVIFFTIGTFVSIFYGYMQLVDGFLIVFVIASPLQVVAFAIYGIKVTILLAASVKVTGSLEMRLARIRMFVLTVVAMLVWVFAFVVSLASALTGDTFDPYHVELVETIINIFFLVAILSLGATYGFAYYTRHLLGNSSFDSKSNPSSSTAPSTSGNKRSDRNSFSNHGNTTTTGGNDFEMKDVVVAVAPAPDSSLPPIQEYQIGDLAVEL